MDTMERPDLVARLRQESLHDTACPHCGGSGQIDAPLLLYRSNANPTVLFSPAQRASDEHNRQQAMALIARLSQSLGADWRDEWIADGIQVVPQNVLPAVVRDERDAGAQEIQESGKRISLSGPAQESRRHTPCAATPHTACAGYDEHKFLFVCT